MKMNGTVFLSRALAIVCGLTSVLIPLAAPAAPTPKAPKRASVTVKASPGNVFEVRNYKLCLRADPSAPPVSLNIDVLNSIITFAPDGGLASKSTEPIVLDAIARDGFTGLTGPAEIQIVNTLRPETVFLVKSGLVRAFGGSIRVQTGRDQPTAGVSESGWESLKYRDLILYTAKGSVRLLTGDFTQKDAGAGQKPVAPAVGGGESFKPNGSTGGADRVPVDGTDKLAILKAGIRSTTVPPERSTVRTRRDNLLKMEQWNAREVETALYLLQQILFEVWADRNPTGARPNPLRRRWGENIAFSNNCGGEKPFDSEVFLNSNRSVMPSGGDFKVLQDLRVKLGLPILRPEELDVRDWSDDKMHNPIRGGRDSKASSGAAGTSAPPAAPPAPASVFIHPAPEDPAQTKGLTPEGKALYQAVTGQRWTTAMDDRSYPWGDLTLLKDRTVARVGGASGKWTLVDDHSIRFDGYTLTFDATFRTFTATRTSDGTKVCTGKLKEAAGAPGQTPR